MSHNRSHLRGPNKTIEITNTGNDGGKRNSSKCKKTVMVHHIVAANTYGAHRQILDLLTSEGITPTHDLQQSDVVLLFCPILTRIQSDLDAAVRKIPDGAKGKPVVLVLMHHTFDPDEVLDRTCWSQQHPCLKGEVRVLFHQNGLLHCDRNKEAVQTLKTLCKEYTTPDGPSSDTDASRNKRQQTNQSEETKSSDSNGWTHLAPEKVKPVNMFTIIMGQTSQAFQKLLEKLRSHSPQITESEDIDGCDAILVISSFQSWHNPYMKAAFGVISAPGKPVVLVLVHQTSDNFCDVPQGTSFSTQKEEVHIEYNYKEKELKDCERNQKAINDLLSLIFLTSSEALNVSRWKHKNYKHSLFQQPVSKK